MSTPSEKSSSKDSVSLSLGHVTGDFLRSKGSTLYSGCCCCCCCFFWVGGAIGTAVGAVVGTRSKSAVKGKDYLFLMGLFWLSFVALSFLSLSVVIVEDDLLYFVAVTAPAAQIFLAFLIVILVGQVRSVQSDQRKTAYLVCLKTFLACLLGYGIGWAAVFALI